MSNRLLAFAFVALSAGAASAQTTSDFDGDAGSTELPVAPRSANPSDAPASLMRDSGLDAGVELVPAEASVADGGRSVAAAVTEAPAPPTEPASGLNFTAALKASLRLSYQTASPFPVDANLNQVALAPLNTRVRVAPELHLNNFALLAEADTATGAIVGIPSAELVGTRVTYPSIAALDLRKLYLEYKWATGVFRVGQQTSQWGLGLLANDGSKDPGPGDFGQQGFGMLTYRALLGARPFFTLGGQWRAIETVFAADLIVRDNNADFIQGDRAFQGVVAVRYAKDEENNFGVYVVYRNQRNIYVVDGGKATDAFVANVAGKWEFFKENDRVLKLGLEAVAITGTTTQARNENAALLGVHQYGAAAKASYRLGHTTLLLDWGFASGDQNPSDDQVQNFRFDRDYKVGLVLFDQVMAYQTARSATRAADPLLTGHPPEGVDLLGTAGSVTGAWYLFPRVRYAMTDMVDLYAGPLFAFSTARLTDPFNTRITGGQSVNAFGVRAGWYLGTEVDAGLQIRYKPIEELLLTITGEGGIFMPGDAYKFPIGGVMSPIGFGRVRASLAF